MVLDLATQKASPLVNNWGGLPFNSPNDVTLHAPSGALLFTDPDYGASNGHRPQPLVGGHASLAERKPHGTHSPRPLPTCATRCRRPSRTNPTAAAGQLGMAL